MLDVNKLENITARQCDRQVYVHIFLNWLHGLQVPYLKLFSGASPMSCLIFARSYWISLYINTCYIRHELHCHPNKERKCFVLILFIEVLVDTQYIFVFPSAAYTNKSQSFPTREKATYSTASCPCAKRGFSKFSPHTCSDLSLCLVDGQCKCESHRKLQTFEFEWHICWNPWDVW